ncbi:PREDICTED: sorting nexin-32-like [Branchiostoma belcheri]|uniref:Sorting nexin-32-like n=1 Tax=Branchiostoma belcheri TaxID=7741 RepID=A0A6P4XLZ0_BRABE|nr:PREDICTED: sorting nexin-32-like [Branchiostoma belcheri]
MVSSDAQYGPNPVGHCAGRGVSDVAPTDTSKMDNATEETNTNGTADVSDSPEADQNTPEPSGPAEPTEPPKPFQPTFTVKVTDAAKDGDVVKYSLKTAKKSGGEEYKVVRQYEDFEWLEHCLVTQNDIGGIIVPPLPPKPSTTAQSAEARSKKQLGNKKRHGSDDDEGNDIKLVVGDEFEKDCRSLEKYLQLVVTHPTLGQDEAITKFLTVRELGACQKQSHETQLVFITSCLVQYI